MSRGKQNTRFLSANSICHGFVYLEMGSNRILLCQPGTWIDSTLFAKFEKSQNNLDYQSVVDESLKEKFKKLINHHLKLEFENEFNDSKNKILRNFNQMIEGQHSFLNWSVACFECFNKLDTDELNKLHETDLNLFIKAHLSSSVAIWLSITNGLYDAAFLEDIYLITFLQDAGLANSSYSYFIREALDSESRIPGEGIKSLIERNANEEEIDLFKNHPFESHEKIKNLNLLNNPELSNTVLFGHELINGEGFPFGYTGQVLANWEKILILADHLVRYNSSFDYDFIKELENIKNSRLNLLPVKNVLRKSIATLSCSDHEASA